MRGTISGVAIALTSLVYTSNSTYLVDDVMRIVIVDNGWYDATFTPLTGVLNVPIYRRTRPLSLLHGCRSFVNTVGCSR